MENDRSRPQGAQPGRPHPPAAPRPSGVPSPEPRGPATKLNAEPEPLPVAPGVGPAAGSKRITAFGQGKRHEDTWSRTPNTTGLGAVHVKTFHGKLTDDALAYLDQCINEWLDSHPQYEVKFVTSTVGILTSKIQEPHLICQVWV